MKFFLLLKFEAKLFFDELLYSIKYWKYNASYFIFFLTIFALNRGLQFFIESPELNKYLINYDFINMKFEIQLAFILLVIYEVFKGFQTSTLENMFNKYDEYFLFSKPILPNIVFLSKYIKKVFFHIVLLSILFITVNPIFNFFNYSIFQIIITYIIIVFLIEYIFILKHINMLLYINKKHYLLYLFGFILISFLISKIILDYFNNIFIYPMYNNINILFPFILIFFYIALLYLLYKFSYSYYDFIIYSSDRKFIYSLNLLKKINFKQNSLINLMLKKDLILLLRNEGSNLFISFVINYLLLYFLYSTDFYINVLKFIPNTYFFYMSPFIFILFIYIRYFDNNILYKEWNNLWYINTFNYDYYSLINIKYLIGYFITIFMSIPYLIIIIIIYNNNIIYVIIIIINLIIVNIPVKYFLIQYFNMYNSRNIDKFLIYFIQILFMFILGGIYLILHSFNITYLYLSMTIMTSLIVTKYGRPIKYYFIELLSNAYIIIITSSIIVSFIIIILSLIQDIIYINNNYYYKLFCFIFTSLTLSLILYKYITYYSYKLLVNKDFIKI